MKLFEIHWLAAISSPCECVHVFIFTTNSHFLLLKTVGLSYWLTFVFFLLVILRLATNRSIAAAYQ